MKTNQSIEMTMTRVQFIYKLQLLGLLGYFLIIPLNNSSLTHIITWAGALLSLLTVVFGVGIISITPGKVRAFFLILFVFLIQLLFHPGEIDLDIVYACFCFLSLCLMLEISRSVYLDQKTLNYAFGVMIAISVLISIYSFFPFAYMRENGTICPYLTLNLRNANYAGMIVLCTLLALAGIQQNYRRNIFIWILDVYLVYLIYKTGSRSCIVAVAAYLVLVLFFRNRRISNWISAVMILIPMLWIPAYLIMYRISSNPVAVLGKNFFTGRENIYYRHLSMLDGPLKLLFGNLMEGKLQNAHNAPLAIACAIGVVGMICFYCLIGSLLYRKKSVKYSPRENLALFTIWGVLIGSSFESSLFLGGFPGVVYVFTLFILLARSSQAGVLSGAENESRIL